MERRCALVCVLLLSAAAAVAADPEPILKSAPMPFYPPVARHARIEGNVTLHMTVTQAGETADVEAVSGHALLRHAAVENIRAWKFAWPHPCYCKVEREVTFVYRLSGKAATTDSPLVMVKWFGASRVEVEADLARVTSKMLVEDCSLKS